MASIVLGSDGKVVKKQNQNMVLAPTGLITNGNTDNYIIA